MGKIIVIKGADFSENAVSYNKSYNYTLVKAAMSPTSGGILVSTYLQRAQVFIPRYEVANPNPWDISYSTKALANAWSMIPVPTGATGVSLSMTNTGYYYGLVLRDANGIQHYDSGWKQGGNDIHVNLSSSYANAVYLTSTFKVGSAGTENFTDETINDVGWSIKWEF